MKTLASLACQAASLLALSLFAIAPLPAQSPGSSGTTTYTPTTIGMSLWLRAGDQFIYAKDGNIAFWPDQSGNNNHAGGDPYFWGEYNYSDENDESNLFSVNDPQIGPVVRHDGGNGLLMPYFTRNAEALDVFVILKSDSACETPISPINITGGQELRYGTFEDIYEPSPDQEIIVDNLGRTTSVTISVPQNKSVFENWRLYNVSASPALWSAYLDNDKLKEVPGTPFVGCAKWVDPNWPYIYAGAKVGGGDHSGYIAEIIVYDRVLSEDERTGVAAYFKEKYQLGINAPDPTNDPTKPLSLTVAGSTNSSLKLIWHPSSKPQASYELERKLKNSGSFAKVADIPAGATTHTDTGLASSTSYVYRIRAKLGSYLTDYSNEATGTTDVLTTSPDTLMVTAATGNSLTLAWLATSNPLATYELERKLLSGGSFAKIADLPAGTTTHVDNGLAPMKTYVYRIRATAGSFLSPYSNEATGSTLLDDGFAAWAIAKGLDPNRPHDTAADGLTYYEKYLMNLNPNVPNNNPVPSLEIFSPRL